MEAYLPSATLHFPVVLLTGARQVGKTSLLKHAGEPARTYVTLDDPLVLSLARTDPGLLLERFPPPVLIDEIQYAPELLPYIKMSADTLRRPNLFWLTGIPAIPPDEGGLRISGRKSRGAPASRSLPA